MFTPPSACGGLLHTNYSQYWQFQHQFLLLVVDIFLVCLWALLLILSVPQLVQELPSFLVEQRPFVVSKLKDYLQFKSVAIAIERSGFKIVLLLRLVPLLPFNFLNYLLSVMPVPLGEYMLASWIGMMPITLVLVYVGTTLKDLSDVTHGWMVLMFWVTKVAKSALNRALAENEDIDGILGSPELPVVADSPPVLSQPLLIKIDLPKENDEKQSS